MANSEMQRGLAEPKDAEDCFALGMSFSSGAGMAVEDACVLVDELANASSIEAALASFMERRFERCRVVVENSVRIGEVQMAGGSETDGSAMLGSTMLRLRDPY